MGWRWGLLPAMVLGALACAMPARSASVECPKVGSLVIVDTKAHKLELCGGGHVKESFSVRLGKHGVGKFREGDGKTPIGRYALSPPITSSSFGLFIPVGYPTPEQRKRGYTGSAIGIHGPSRGVRWLGALVNTFDLTDGCIGIATDDEMKRVASFVTKHGAREVLIR